jgi:hypothetical protein
VHANSLGCAGVRDQKGQAKLKWSEILSAASNCIGGGKL